MKKLLFSLLASLALATTFSCSKSDTPSTTQQSTTPGVSKMSFTINGVQKTYNTFSASDFTETNSGTYNGNYTRISASLNGNASDAIEFNIHKSQTGLSSKGWVHIYYNSKDYFDSVIGDPYELSLNITENSASKISGSFSGQIAYFENGTGYVPATITNGTFEYYY